MLTAAVIAGSSMVIASIFSYTTKKHALDLEMQKIFRARGWVTENQRTWKLQKAVIHAEHAVMWYKIPAGISYSDLMNTDKQYVNLPGILSEVFDCLTQVEREQNLLKISLNSFHPVSFTGPVVR